MLRTKSFGFRVTDGHATGVTDVFHWWNEIHESQHSERAIFFTLCAAYALVSIVALVLISPFPFINLHYKFRIVFVQLDHYCKALDSTFPFF